MSLLRGALAAAVTAAAWCGAPDAEGPDTRRDTRTPPITGLEGGEPER